MGGLILSQNILNHVSMDIGEASFETIVIVSEPFMVEAKEV